MDQQDKITESASSYRHLERMSVTDLLQAINDEDQQVAMAVGRQIPAIEAFLTDLVPRFRVGGRLFYVGAGTSGRLGILDASEIPPTYGLPPGRVIGLIAGGDVAIRQAVEFAEDSPHQAVLDLQQHALGPRDAVVGIAASGTTPYVFGAVSYAQQQGALTACLTNNPRTLLAAAVTHPIEVVVGPEFVSGSTRMKSGTAQKMVLNMISTVLMIRIGRVQDNKMVHMQLSNQKLIERGVRFLVEELQVEPALAKELLARHGTVRAAMEAWLDK
ncbi:MAG: N-acetylmuramic acid 6-phosphate etherase [Lewinella sp.]|nr:N-acetylmuramic acid 6-phosphate etherase [Lewinella sp.]